MEPITTAIVAALASLAEPAVKDAYQALKSLIVRKLGEGSEVLTAVESLESKPDSAGRRETLNEEVAASPAAGDAEILAAVQALTAALEKLPGGSCHVQQSVTGDRNVFSGTGDISIGGPPR